MDVVYLDFEKPFDKMPHQRLFLKLKAHRIGNDVINWLEKWLTHKRQRVIVDGDISSWKYVLSGVPQGSVLGPTLFLIYIYVNDFEDDISNNVLKFTDDTKVFRKVTNDTDKQSLDDLDKLVKWSEKNVKTCFRAMWDSKGNQIIELIRRTIIYTEKQLIVPLYIKQ